VADMWLMLCNPHGRGKGAAPASSFQKYFPRHSFDEITPVLIPPIRNSPKSR